MRHLAQWIGRLHREDPGQALAEYALIFALIVSAAFIMLATLATGVDGLVTSVVSAFA